MPTKYKKDLILRKRRMESINKYEARFKVGDRYLVGTDDYTQEEIGVPIKNLTKEVPVDIESDTNKTVCNNPLWDWFTIADLKKNKIWYCDFSMPYYYEEKDHDKDFISKIWAESEVPLKIKKGALPNKMFTLDFIQDEELVKQKADFYLKHNDWEKTFSLYEKESKSKLEWNQEVPLVYSNMKHDMGIVIPFSFEELSIFEVFKKSIDLFFNSKQGSREKALHLISETQYKKFV